MARKYYLTCAGQSYSISLEMCLARQGRGDSRCNRCKVRPKPAEAEAPALAAEAASPRGPAQKAA